MIRILERNKININFISCEPKIDYIISCYDSNLFSTIEQKFYNKFPDLKEKNVLFQLDGNKIDKTLSLEQNNIKDETIILINEVSQEENTDVSNKIIAVIFISLEHKINYAMTCFITNTFSTIQQRLYEEYPELEKRNIIFKANGRAVDESETLEKNHIKNGTNISIIDENIDKNIDENIDETKGIISVMFVSVDQKIHHALVCSIYEQISHVKLKLCDKFPELKERNILFFANGLLLDESLTLKESKIKNGQAILIYYLE